MLYSLIIRLFFVAELTVQRMVAPWLLGYVADPNQGCLVDITPLTFAVKNASVFMISLLYSCGGDAKKGQSLYHI